jgi:hypothetical protein
MTGWSEVRQEMPVVDGAIAEVGMDALVVLFLFLLGLRLLGSVLYLRVSRARRTPPDGADVPHRKVDPCLAPAMALPPEPPESAESELYAKLASGTISRRQYRDRMAALAARDDGRRHLQAPQC